MITELLQQIVSLLTALVLAITPLPSSVSSLMMDDYAVMPLSFTPTVLLYGARNLSSFDLTAPPFQTVQPSDLYSTFTFSFKSVDNNTPREHYVRVGFLFPIPENVNGSDTFTLSVYPDFGVTDAGRHSGASKPWVPGGVPGNPLTMTYGLAEVISLDGMTLINSYSEVGTYSQGKTDYTFSYSGSYNYVYFDAYTTVTINGGWYQDFVFFMTSDSNKDPTPDPTPLPPAEPIPDRDSSDGGIGPENQPGYFDDEGNWDSGKVQDVIEQGQAGNFAGYQEGFQSGGSGSTNGNGTSSAVTPNDEQAMADFSQGAQDIFGSSGNADDVFGWVNDSSIFSWFSREVANDLYPPQTRNFRSGDTVPDWAKPPDPDMISSDGLIHEWGRGKYD